MSERIQRSDSWEMDYWWAILAGDNFSDGNLLVGNLLVDNYTRGILMEGFLTGLQFTWDNFPITCHNYSAEKFGYIDLLFYHELDKKYRQ